MRRSAVILSFLLLIVLLAPSAASARVERDMPSYWIKKLEAPDSPILLPAEIEALNSAILEKNDQMAGLESLPGTISRDKLLEWLLYDPIPSFENTGVWRYDSRGRRVRKAFYEKLLENMNIGAIKDDNGVRFGLITARADIRAFPTDEPLLKKPGSLEFDTLQYSSVYPPEAVALLHTSGDGRWGYFQTSTVRGWMPLDRVVFGERENVLEKGESFLVVTASRLDVYKDRAMKKALGVAPMGAVLYLSDDKGTGPFRVKFPGKGADGGVWTTGYIRRGADVSAGFLPYTPRNVISQAFKMLGEGYGWGGKGGRRDCSEFIKDIFATMGIRMPRNSGQQGLSGHVKAHADESYTKGELAQALKEARPGMTLITLKGHIMLYIGSVKGNPYVIHQIFGYMDGGRQRLLRRVAVTGLDLGRHSKAGPIKERIRGVTEVTSLGDRVIENAQRALTPQLAAELAGE